MNWNIKKISLHFDLWNFDKGATQQIDAKLQTGIVIASQGFSMGPIQQIATSAQVRNVYQINNSIPSLRTFYMWFLLNDYQTLNFCRKNFKVSHNLKSIQLKMNNDYIPKQPIMGNAGQIAGDGINNDDVLPFLMELYRTHGESFSTAIKSSIVPANFIVNDRCYNPLNKSQTKNQYGMYQEQRLQGKATYCIDLLADPYDNTVLSGLDTTRVRPIELIIDNYTNAGVQQRPSTMYVTLHHDVLVSYGVNGIETVGYG